MFDWYERILYFKGQDGFENALGRFSFTQRIDHDKMSKNLGCKSKAIRNPNSVTRQFAQVRRLRSDKADVRLIMLNR